MTRYIDADKLKEDILEENSWYLYNEFGSTTQFHELIDKQPTADVVEVVRCKDCKKASTTEYLYCTNDGIAECQSVYCGHYRIYMELNHYCSHGERRE